MHQELKSYIDASRASGMRDDDISRTLIGNGWDQNTVHLALGQQGSYPVPPSPTPITTNPLTATRMWDAFEHILLFISLYVFAFSASMLLHTMVDKWHPDIATMSDSYSYDIYYNDWEDTIVRGYLAAIIVSFPLFAALFLQTTKRSFANPSIRKLTSRKILIYLTLVITFLILLWKLSYTVFTFLSGNVSMNFVLHFIVTVSITGFIFGYYYRQVKEDREMSASL